MTDEERTEFDNNKEEIVNLRNQLDELNKELDSYDGLLPSMEETRNNDNTSKETIMTKENLLIIV